VEITMKKVCCLTTLVFLHAAAVSAEIVPAQQRREVASFGAASTADESDSDGAQVLASDFGPFDALAGHAARAGSASADGFAQQNSTIEPLKVHALLSADAFVGVVGFTDSADAGSTSSFDLQFTVDEAASFRIAVTGFASNNGSAGMFLDSIPTAGNGFYYDTSFGDAMEAVIDLEPGTVYQLGGSASASAFMFGVDGQPDGRAGLEFTLTQVPEPASWALLAVAGVAAVAFQRRRK
jgi:hypothetical protein